LPNQLKGGKLFEKKNWGSRGLFTTWSVKKKKRTRRRRGQAGEGDISQTSHSVKAMQTSRKKLSGRYLLNTAMSGGLGSSGKGGGEETAREGAEKRARGEAHDFQNRAPREDVRKSEKGWSYFYSRTKSVSVGQKKKKKKKRR